MPSTPQPETDFPHDAGSIGHVPLTATKGQVINVADHQALGHVLGRERPLSIEVIPVLHFSDAALQPSGQGVRIGQEFFAWCTQPGTIRHPVNRFMTEI